MKKTKANHMPSPQDLHLNNTSAGAQRSRLLQRLALGPITTIEAARELNILRPAARVKELRDAGYNIQTERVSTLDDQGRKHGQVAKYYLSSTATAAKAVA